MDFNEIEIGHLQRQIESLNKRNEDLMMKYVSDANQNWNIGFKKGYADGYAKAKEESKAFIKDLLKEITQ